MRDTRWRLEAAAICWSTCGKRPGASSTGPTRPPRRGSTRRRPLSSAGRPARVAAAKQADGPPASPKLSFKPSTQLKRPFCLPGNGFWAVFGFPLDVLDRGGCVSVDWLVCRSLHEVGETLAALAPG